MYILHGLQGTWARLHRYMVNQPPPVAALSCTWSLHSTQYSTYNGKGREGPKGGGCDAVYSPAPGSP